MRDDSQLSALIGHIYDAALDSGAWPQALEETATYVGGGACNLSSHDMLNVNANVHVDWGSDPVYVNSFMLEYSKIYPLSPIALAYFAIGQPMSAELMMPYDELQRSRFFVEWAVPQRLRDVIACILEKSDTSFSSVAVMRYERHGLADDEARSRLGLLAPHFRRSVLIGKVLEMRTGSAAMLAETIDGLSAGVFVVDQLGGLVRTNEAADLLLARGDILRSRQGRLVATEKMAARMLQLAVDSAGEIVAPASEHITVHLADEGKDRWIAHVLPLTSGRRWDQQKGAAAIFVQKVALGRPPALQAIAERFDLTPTELRVMLAIAEFGSVPEAAPILGIASSTIRSHLIQIYGKTGCKRQAELVRLLASFAGPLR